MFGNAVESDIHNAVQDSKNEGQAQQKAMRTLHKWLDQDGDMRGMFRDPVRG